MEKPLNPSGLAGLGPGFLEPQISAISIQKAATGDTSLSSETLKAISAGATPPPILTTAEVSKNIIEERERAEESFRNSPESPATIVDISDEALEAFAATPAGQAAISEQTVANDTVETEDSLPAASAESFVTTAVQSAAASTSAGASIDIFA